MVQQLIGDSTPVHVCLQEVKVYFVSSVFFRCTHVQVHQAECLSLRAFLCLRTFFSALVAELAAIWIMAFRWSMSKLWTFITSQDVNTQTYSGVCAPSHLYFIQLKELLCLFLLELNNRCSLPSRVWFGHMDILVRAVSTSAADVPTSNRQF